MSTREEREPRRCLAGTRLAISSHVRGKAAQMPVDDQQINVPAKHTMLAASQDTGLDFPIVTMAGT